MKRRASLEILYSSDDLAGLFGEDPALIHHLVAQGIHPPWVWRPRMKGPRWNENSIPAWRNILDHVEVSLNGNPKAPEHPLSVFSDPEKERPARAATLSRSGV